jgi:tRNA threonylcarbamoyladenosine biosynthesis protein TsaE
LTQHNKIGGRVVCHSAIVENTLERATPIQLPMPSPDTTTLHLRWATEADTQAFALQLARQPQIRHAIVTLHGDLGAGKTTLVRHLLRALGVTGRVKSPTYAVVEPHQVLPAAGSADAPLDIWHFDFYRFDDPREWEDAGFRDLFASPGLKLVEWPQNAGDTLPTPDLALHLHTLDDDSRQVTVQAHTAHGQHCLAGLCAALAATDTPLPAADTPPEVHP